MATHAAAPVWRAPSAQRRRDVVAPAFTPSRPWHTRRAILCHAALALGLMGCASGSDISGFWRSETPAAEPILGSATRPMSVELVLGHYGRDLAGVLRFYLDEGFEQPADAGVPHFDCGCALIHRGRWSEDSQRATFELRGCLPGASPKAPILAAVVLTEVDGELSGAVSLAGPATATQPLRLRRAGAVDDADLGCDPYTDAALGNVANGQ